MKEKEKISDQLNKVSGGGRGAKHDLTREKTGPDGNQDTTDKNNANAVAALRTVAHKNQTAAAKTGNAFKQDTFNAANGGLNNN